MSPPPPPAIGLAVRLANQPFFFLPGRRAIKPRPERTACSPALSASPAISRRPQPGQSGLMHSPPLAPTPWGCLSKARLWGETEAEQGVLGPTWTFV